MRILLTSDIHISNDNHLDVLQSLVNIANNDNCQYFFIAGDLFNSNEDAITFSQPVKQILSQFEGTLYCIPGNHDIDLPQSFSLSNGICFNAIQEISLLDGFTLLALPYQINESFSSVRKKTHFPKLTHKTIILAHGTLYDSPFFLKSDNRTYFPISINDVTESGVKYFCLGHYHTVIKEKIGTTICLNAGAPRATRSSDLGKRSCFIIDTDSDQVITRYIQTEYNVSINVNVNLINEVNGYDKLISDSINSLQILNSDYPLINLNVNLIGISTKVFNEADVNLQSFKFKSCKFNCLELKTLNSEIMSHPVVNAIKTNLLQSGDENKEKVVLSILTDALMRGL